MTTYEITVVDEPEEGTRPLDRLGGAPAGLKTADWPRCRGVPMQLLATVELEGRHARSGAAMVFVDSYTETDLGDREAVAVRLVSREDIDAVGETAPPDDYVAEPWAGAEERLLCLEELEDDDDIGDDSSYIGANAVWPEETGEPGDAPSGAFIMRLMGHDAPFCRVQSAMLVFEGGAIITPQYELEDDEVAPSWPEAVAAAREIVIADEAPGDDALVKFGGAPKASYDWPTDSRDRPLAHLMTLPAEMLRDQDDDAVAVAYFADMRRIGRSDWDGQPDFIETEIITTEMLEDEDAHELPDGVELLPAKRLALRPFGEGLTWRDLRDKSFVGPRGAFLNPQADCADPGHFELQLSTALLPGSAEDGMLYFSDGSYPFFQRPGETGRGEDDYDGGDFFGFDSDDEDDDGDAPAGGVAIRRGDKGMASTSYVGGLPPAIDMENWPRYEGELMTHVMTIDLSQVPDLADRGAGAISVFVSTAMSHKAFGPDSEHSAVLALKPERLDGRETPPDGEVVEVLDEHPLVLEQQDTLESPMVFAGGNPRWLQAPQYMSLFVAQVDEDIVDINLGDCGTLYVFADTAFFQCH
jgi:hypothetical protein